MITIGRIVNHLFTTRNSYIRSSETYETLMNLAYDVVYFNPELRHFLDQQSYHKKVFLSEIPFWNLLLRTMRKSNNQEMNYFFKKPTPPFTFFQEISYHCKNQ